MTDPFIASYAISFHERRPWRPPEQAQHDLAHTVSLRIVAMLKVAKITTSMMGKPYVSFRSPKLRHAWASHTRCSVPGSTTGVSLVPASKPALQFPQAYTFPQNLRYVPILLWFIRNVVFVPGKRKRDVHWFSTVPFLPLALRQRTHRNAIQFAMYCSSILSQGVKSGKGVTSRRYIHD